MSKGRQLSFENPRLLREIKERGAAEFEHNISVDQIDDLIDCYTRFTTNWGDPEPETMDAMLPDAPIETLAKQLDDLDRSKDKQKNWHKYRTNAPWIAKPVGYTNRYFQSQALQITRGINLPEDDKEFFHYTPGMKDVVERQHEQYGWGKPPQEFYMLCNAFIRVHTASRKLTEKILSVVEDTHPNIRQLVTPSSTLTSPVRLVGYHRGDQQELGAGHYDKSVFTFQLAESHEGLRIAKDNNSPLEIVRRESDKAVFFPSKSLKDNYPDTPFTPGWHDIIKSETLNHGRHMSEATRAVFGRWALIFFVNEENFVQHDKSLTHHR